MSYISSNNWDRENTYIKLITLYIGKSSFLIRCISRWDDARKNRVPVITCNIQTLRLGSEQKNAPPPTPPPPPTLPKPRSPEVRMVRVLRRGPASALRFAINDAAASGASLTGQCHCRRLARAIAEFVPKLFACMRRRWCRDSRVLFCLGDVPGNWA